MTRAAEAMRRLNAADPSIHERPPDGAAMERIRERVPAAARPLRTRRSLRPGRLALATGSVVAATVAASVILPLGGDPTPSAEAAQVLTSAAGRVGHGPSYIPRPGQFYYRRAQGVSLNAVTDSAGLTTMRRERSIQELWIARDGSGRIGSGPDRPAAPDDFGPGGLAVPFGSRSLSMPDLEGLPTDPDALAGVIEDSAVRNSHPLAYQELDLVAEVLRNAPVSPALGAAFYEALARFPGIEALGERTDSVGRTGQAVGATDAAGVRLEIIIDPASGELLADRSVATRDVDGLRAGDLLSEFTYVERGVVASVGERPARNGG